MRVWPASRGGRFRLLALILLVAVAGWIERGPCYEFVSRLPAISHYFGYSPQEGDIVFQSLPHGDLVDAIEGITHSPYSHCGVVLQNEKHDWVVIEAIGNVHETPLLLWEARGRNGAFTAYRLDAKYEPMIPKFKDALLSRLGLPYDFNYDISNQNGAYCSSLIWLSFEQVTAEKMGNLEKLRDLDWKPFEAFIETEQGGGLPLDRVMITPASLARATQLHEVYRGGM